MAKRARLSSSFNPVYPYEDESTTHPFINPGFISPDGFAQSPDGVLTLKCISPLNTTGGSLQLKVGGGLKVDSTDGSLEENINTTAPLTKTNHSISMLVGNGLHTEENKLCAKLGQGLEFNSGSICIDHNTNTLWTGVPTEANCHMLEYTDDKDCKLTLVLVKNGAMVNGYVSLMGATDEFNAITTVKIAQLTADIYFDTNGKVLTDISALKTELKYKSGQNMATGEPSNSKSFMPSLTAYPLRNPTIKPVRGNEDYIYGTTYFRSSDDALLPLDTYVMLNYKLSNAQCAYAMHFMWSWNTSIKPEETATTFIASPFTFSYIREDD